MKKWLQWVENCKEDENRNVKKLEEEEEEKEEEEEEKKTKEQNRYIWVNMKKQSIAIEMTDK